MFDKVFNILIIKLSLSSLAGAIHKSFSGDKAKAAHGFCLNIEILYVLRDYWTFERRADVTDRIIHEIERLKPKTGTNFYSN